MKSFIKKQEYNYIKKCLYDLNNSFRNCLDSNIIKVNKSCINEKILNLFTNLSEQEKNLLDITKITEPSYINNYLSNLDQYVYGMPALTSTQIIKLFKKEKNLKLPDLDKQNSKNVYLGFIDKSKKKLFVAYNINGTLLKMTCRILDSNSKNTHKCALCNTVGGPNKVAFVSCVCKSGNSKKGSYRSIGFHICLDSKKCNERIVSTEKLEKILKDVNNIK